MVWFVIVDVRVVVLLSMMSFFDKSVCFVSLGFQPIRDTPVSDSTSYLSCSDFMPRPILSTNTNLVWHLEPVFPFLAACLLIDLVHN